MAHLGPALTLLLALLALGAPVRAQSLTPELLPRWSSGAALELEQSQAHSDAGALSLAQVVWTGRGLWGGGCQLHLARLRPLCLTAWADASLSYTLEEARLEPLALRRQAVGLSALGAGLSWSPLRLEGDRGALLLQAAGRWPGQEAVAPAAGWRWGISWRAALGAQSWEIFAVQGRGAGLWAQAGLWWRAPLWQDQLYGEGLLARAWLQDGPTWRRLVGVMAPSSVGALGVSWESTQAPGLPHIWWLRWRRWR